MYPFWLKYSPYPRIKLISIKVNTSPYYSYMSYILYILFRNLFSLTLIALRSPSLLRSYLALNIFTTFISIWDVFEPESFVKIFSAWLWINSDGDFIRGIDFDLKNFGYFQFMKLYCIWTSYAKCLKNPKLKISLNATTLNRHWMKRNQFGAFSVTIRSPPELCNLINFIKVMKIII